MRTCGRRLCQSSLARPVQVIVSGVKLPWRSVDLSLLEEGQTQARLAQLQGEDRRERFDLRDCAAFALQLGALGVAAASAGVDEPSHSDGWVVAAGVGAASF